MNTAPEAPKRPVLRYHCRNGGKWRLAPWIIAHLPPHRVYVEPFGGAGSVLLRKRPSPAEVYNDLDGEVVHLFRVLRDPLLSLQLRHQVTLTPYAREEFRAAYEPTDNPVERARRYLVRSWMAFGTSSRKLNVTGFRATGHRRGGGTATREWTGMPEVLEAVTRRMGAVLIEQRPALEVLAQQDAPDVVFYLDPPYPFSTRTSARRRSRRESAYAHNLSDDEHTQLAAALANLRGMALVSGYRCPLYDELFAGWHRTERAAMADGAIRRTECLWLSPRCTQALGLLAPGRQPAA